MLTIWGPTDKRDRWKYLEAIRDLLPEEQVQFIPSPEVFPEPADGDVVLALGAKTVELLQKTGRAPKNLALGSLIEKALPNKKVGKVPAPNTGWFLASQAPNSVFADPANADLITYAARLAVRLHETGTVIPEVGEYRWVSSFADMIERIKAKFAETGQKVDGALDLETQGLHPWYPDKGIVSVSFSYEEGLSELIYTHGLDKGALTQVIAELQWLLTTDILSLKGANLKFDLIWLAEKWGLECTNFKMDTLVVGSLLNENRSNSLNRHAKTYTSIGGYDDLFNSSYDKGKMEKVPKDALLVYAGGDTDATLRVANVLRKELSQDKRLQRFYVKLLHPAVRTFERVERRGVHVNVDTYAALRKDVERRVGELEQEAISLLPARLRAKHAEAGLALSRPSLLHDFMFTSLGLNLKPKMVTEKSKKPSTAAAHFDLFSDHPVASKFVEAYKEWSACKKTLSTYIDGFLVHLRPDGRLHPTYMFFNGSMFGDRGDDSGTVTGRLSAKEPAMQTLPKHTAWAKRLRECFDAPPGYLVWEVDFSQGELRIIADIADEPRMLDAYRNDIDLHMITGARLAGMDFEEFTKALAASPDEYKPWRQRAKPANFGLCYGSTAEGYRAFAKGSYGLDLTSEEAEQHVAIFFDTYSALPAWHERAKNYAEAKSQIETPLGRIRHLPLIKSSVWKLKSKAQRQAINSPIQATLSDLCLWAGVFIEDRYGDGADVQMVGGTHDSLYGYVREEKAAECVPEILAMMENLPIEQTFGWKPQVFFAADGQVGPNMAQLADIER